MPSKLNSKEFQRQLAELAQAQIALIEAECAGFKTDPVAQSIRQKQAQSNFKYFCSTYFPHYVKGAASIFHDWCHDELAWRVDDAKRGYKLGIAAPRGEAKSTLVTQLFALWCIVTQRKHFIGILMDAADQAWQMLEVIKIELATNPRLKMDFPDASGAGRVWQVGEIITANNIKVKTAGATKRLRGWRFGAHRPDLILMDDLENDENVRNKEQRDKLENWIKRAVLKLGSADGTMDVFYLGTILHYDSVLNRVLNSGTWQSVRFSAIVKWPDRMDLWEQWEEVLLNQGEDASDVFYNERKDEMDKGAVVSWPSMRPLLLLMKIRAEGHDAFQTELQNQPTESENNIFRQFHYWVQPLDKWVFYGALDPSLGKRNKRSDPSAILVGGINLETGVLDVVEAQIRRRVPDKIIEDVIAFQKQYPITAWAVEVVQFQEFLGSELVKRSAAAGVPVPAIPVRPTTDKELRIESLQPHVANGLIRFHRNQTTLIEHLRFWPEAPHDDGADALEMLWQMAHKRAGGLPSIKSTRSSLAFDMGGFNLYG